MMHWMRRYDSPADTSPRNKALQYLENQHDSIRRVKKTMLTAIRKAREVLEKHAGSE